MFPDDLYYSRDHEWVRLDGNLARIGITSFAADALGDVVYVTLPEEGADVTADGPLGEVESTKSVSEIFSPVTGHVTSRNEALETSPELINSDPYGEGWIAIIELADPAQVQSLMGPVEYAAHTKSE